MKKTCPLLGESVEVYVCVSLSLAFYQSPTRNQFSLSLSFLFHLCGPVGEVRLVCKQRADEKGEEEEEAPFIHLNTGRAY